MKKKISKTILFIIFTFLCVSIIGINQKAEVRAADTLTLSQLQAKFPANKYWNHTSGSSNNPDGYTSTPCGSSGMCTQHGNHSRLNGSCGCNCFSGAIQCMGFAFKCGYDTTGSNPRNWSTTTSLSSLKAGDIIRYKNDGHSIFVTNVSGDTITYGDCNSDGHCKIKWGKSISKSTVSETLTRVYVSPNTLTIDSETTSNLQLAVNYDGAQPVFNWSGLSASKYHLKIWKDTLFEGDAYKIYWNITENAKSVALPVGKYQAYIDADDGNGNLTMSNVVDVTVGCTGLDLAVNYDGAQPVFNWSGLSASKYHLKIWKDTLFEGDAYKIYWNITENAKSVALPVGKYQAYIDADDGNGNLTMSNVVDVTVGCTGLDLAVNYDDGQPVFNWCGLSASKYHLKIWKDTLFEGDAYQIYWNITENAKSVALPVGKYQAYIDADDGNGNLTMSNVVDVNVGCTGLDLAVNYDDGQPVFNWCGLSASKYHLKIWKDTLFEGDAYQIYWNITENKKAVILPIGKYKAYIDADDGNGNLTMSNVVDVNITSEHIHQWQETATIDQEATCTVDGSQSIHCKRCDENKDIEVIPATGHIWGEGVVTKAATEESEGEETYTCILCGATKTESIEVLEHTHNWNEGTVTKEATCVAQGIRTYKCSECEQVKNELIDKNPNNHIGSTTVKDKKVVTCGEDGYTGDTYCSGCGVKLESGETISATGEHTWDDGVVTKKATDTEQGEKTFTCTVCGETKTEFIDKLTHTHTWDEGTVVQKATCSYKGIKTYQCTGCDEEKSEILDIDPDNHTGNTTIKNEKAATCGEDGYTGDTYCSDCNAKIKSGSVISATGNHVWDEGKVTKEATEDSTGEKTYTCTECGKTKTEEIAKLPHTHKWDDGTVTEKATCCSKGIRTYTCSGCEETKTEEIAVDPDNHVGKTYIKGIKEATCKEEGYTGDTCCSSCDKVLEEGKTVEKTDGHVIVIDEAVPATNTTGGKTEGCHCSVCDKVFVEQSETSAISTATLYYGVDKTYALTSGAAASWKITSGSSYASLKGTTVTVKKKGTVKVKDSKSGKTVTIYIKAPTIAVNKTSVSLERGETYQLTATATPATTATFYVASSKYKKYATVSSEGLITASSSNSGTCYIYAKANGVTAKIKVVVKKPTITVNKTSVTLKRGGTYQLTGTATPKADITYTVASSKYKKYATVSEDGLITASTTNKGTCYIYAKANGISKKIKVTVK